MMIHQNHFSYCLYRVCVSVFSLLALLSTRETAFVQALSSCSAPQSIVGSFSVSETLTANPDYFNLYDLCGAGAFESSGLPQGHWYSYTPSESITARVALLGEVSLSDAPNIYILKGTCDSLTCSDENSFIVEQVIETKAGEQYFIFLYDYEDGFDKDYSYELVFEEYAPPANDEMEGAVALTQDDLPFQGDYTLDGALSDFSEDACALDGNYGVWFTYTTQLPAELVVLKATLRGSLYNRNVIGVQAQDGDTFVCITIGNDSDRSVEWTAEANVQYYILMGDRWPQSDGAFELTVQSRGPVELPTTPSNPEPAPSPPVSAPGTSEEEPAPEESPVAAPDADKEGTEATPPTSETGRPGVGFGTRLALLISCLIFA